uniref:uncharacterized protein LOC120334959 n=1 Tax=Styela clava TaxID=7725 RepID=UPI00193A94DE|nr:uncharacterized protein LOC120334959 [Styela clava]
MSQPNENSQVLPQFRDTKLGKFRIGKSSSGGGFYLQYDWKIIVLYLAVNLAFLTMSLILLIGVKVYVPGWVVLGIWVVLTICGIICVVIEYYRSRKHASKSSKQERIEMELKATQKESLSNFPCDPVMNRAITNLVFHGQGDCDECRLLRHREDYNATQRMTSYPSPTPSTGKVFPKLSTPILASGSINTSYQSSPAHSGQAHLHGFQRPMSGPSKIEVRAVVERSRFSETQTNFSSDYYDEIDDDDDVFYNANNNNNNNRKTKVNTKILIENEKILTNSRSKFTGIKTNTENSFLSSTFGTGTAIDRVPLVYESLSNDSFVSRGTNSRRQQHSDVTIGRRQSKKRRKTSRRSVVVRKYSSNSIRRNDNRRKKKTPPRQKAKDSTSSSAQNYGSMDNRSGINDRRTNQGTNDIMMSLHSTAQ